MARVKRAGGRGTGGDTSFRDLSGKSDHPRDLKGAKEFPGWSWPGSLSSRKGAVLSGPGTSCTTPWRLAGESLCTTPESCVYSAASQILTKFPTEC